MKKIFALALAVSFVTTSAFAGVSSIRSNGNVSGVPSWVVECSSGSSYVI